MNFESLVGHINQVQDVLHEIVQTASAQLEEWCTPPEKLFYRLHFSNLSYIATIDDPLKRAFYEQEAIRGCWTYRELDRQVSSQYYERMGLSKDKKALQKLAEKNAQQLAPRDILHNQSLREQIPPPAAVRGRYQAIPA